MQIIGARIPHWFNEIDHSMQKIKDSIRNLFLIIGLQSINNTQNRTPWCEELTGLTWFLLARWFPEIFWIMLIIYNIPKYFIFRIMIGHQRYWLYPRWSTTACRSRGQIGSPPGFPIFSFRYFVILNEDSSCSTRCHSLLMLLFLSPSSFISCEYLTLASWSSFPVNLHFRQNSSLSPINLDLFWQHSLSSL